jgi:hypothetical protein
LAADFFAAAAGGAGDCAGAGTERAAGAAAVAAGFSRTAGSADMILTGGIEFDDGKSALVGLPVGIEGG